MRVAFYFGAIQPNNIGGGSTFESSILEELEKRTFPDITYVYYIAKDDLFKDSDSLKFINLGNDKLYKKVNSFFLKKKYKKRSILDDIFKRDQIDCAYFLYPFFEPPTKIPYIITIWDLAHKKHTYFPEVSFNNIYEQREFRYRNLIGKASLVVIGNDIGKQQVHDFYNIPYNRIKTIDMFTPDYVYSIKEETSILKQYSLENKKYLLYPAQFWSHKNHIRLVKAMKELKKQEFVLVFTGSDQGNLTYIKEKIVEYNLEKYVYFLGFVDKKDLVTLYKHAYALTYASAMGPDNIPPLEAMALNCPVICSDYDGAIESLKDSVLFFDKYNENDFIQKVYQLKDESVKQVLIQKGSILAKERHVSNYVDKILDILNNFSKIRECWL